ATPSDAVTRWRSTTTSIFSFRKVTWPSAKSTLAPLPWKLKISSLGPQLVRDCQGQPAGPPNGLLLLLIACSCTPDTVAPVSWSAHDSGLPETPKPLSGSAQRWKCRMVGVSMGST